MNYKHYPRISNLINMSPIYINYSFKKSKFQRSDLQHRNLINFKITDLLNHYSYTFLIKKVDYNNFLLRRYNLLNFFQNLIHFIKS